MTNLATEDILSAVFLGIIVLMLLLAVGGRRMQRSLQQLAVWALIFVAVAAAFGIWEEVRVDTQRQSAFTAEGRVEVPRSRDGHYYLRADVNGAPVDFVVDTGASEIVLTREDAARAGLDVRDLKFFGRASTANGVVRTAPVRLDAVDLGGIRDENVTAFVNEGEMFQSLLGMSYLHRWDKIEIADGKLILSR